MKTTTMVKPGNGKHHKSKKKVDLANLANLDGKALEAELEREYMNERFYDVGPIWANFSLLFLGIYLFLFCFIPGARWAASVGSVFWLGHFFLCKYISKYKGTEHEGSGRKHFETFNEVFGVVHEILQVSNDSLSSEKGRNAHVSMLILTIYFLSAMLFRMMSPRNKKNPYVPCFIFPLIILKKPRFGIFSPHYEALAFLVAFGVGIRIGVVIDEMRWNHFLAIHKKELEIYKKMKELSKESRKREMAMEVLSSYNDTSTFFELR